MCSVWVDPQPGKPTQHCRSITCRHTLSHNRVNTTILQYWGLMIDTAGDTPGTRTSKITTAMRAAPTSNRLREAIFRNMARRAEAAPILGQTNVRLPVLCKAERVPIPEFMQSYKGRGTMNSDVCEDHIRPSLLACRDPLTPHRTGKMGEQALGRRSGGW